MTEKILNPEVKLNDPLNKKEVIMEHLLSEGQKDTFFDYYQHPNYYKYLDELRQKLYNLVIVFIVFFFGGFFLTAPILKQLVIFFQIKGVAIITNSPFQFLDLAMNTGLIVALIFCTPLFVFYTYNFLKDGFNRREKRIFLILLPVSLILFFIGFVYGFAILYSCLEAIARVNLNVGVQNLWDIDQYFSQIIMTAILLGFIFEYPIVLTFLLKLKVIKVSFLKKNRRYAIVVIFIIVSLLPPTDGLSLLIMSVPLILIYELTILVNSLTRIKE